MEKVIEKLEKRIERFTDTVEDVTREIEERTADKEQALAEINEHRTYIEQLKKALATTEKDGGATHEFLSSELERVRRNRERVENNALPIIERDIESLREDAKVIGEKLEDAEYTLARLKGEVPKAVGNIVLGGSLPFCEVKVDMDDTLKILKESFPTMEDFLKWLYGDKAVKEYQCPHNRTQQMAVVDGTITFCTDCRKELVEPSI